MWDENQKDPLLWELKELKKEMITLKHVISNWSIAQQELIKKQTEFTELNLKVTKITIELAHNLMLNIK